MNQKYTRTKLSSLEWVWMLVKPYTYWALISVLSTIAFAACSILSADFIRQMIDNTLKGESQSVTYTVGLLAGIILIGLTAKYFMTYSSGILGAYTMRDMRRGITTHIGRLPVSAIDSSNMGDFTSRMTNDASVFESFLVNDLTNFIYVPLTVICTLIYLILLNWKLLIFSFIATPVLMFLTNKLNKPIGKYSSKYFGKMGEANSIIQDSIGGINILKAFNLEKRMYQKYKSRLEESLNMGLKMEINSHLILPFVILMYELPYILCAILGGYLALNHELSAGSLVAFLQLLRLLVTPSTQLPGMISNARSISGAVVRLKEISTQEAERESGSSIVYNNDVPVIEFVGVTFGYVHDNTVVKNMNFRINRGETTALVGSSGCGKSTIINLICNFYTPDSGSIKLYGRDMKEWSLHSIREHLSLVSQDVYLFPGTIEENIRYGRQFAKNEEVIAAAVSANAHEFIMEFKDGYNTLVGERGVKLSVGQRQRISLARAILKDAPILLLDEPTSALDAKSEMLVQDALERFSKGRTVLVIAHRLSTIKHADNILVIKDGTLIESGCHEDLVSNSNVYKQLYEKQFSQEEIIQNEIA